MTAIQELLARNRSTATAHPYGVGPTATAAAAAVLCRVDRVDADAAFGLIPDEAHPIRDAGRAVTDDVIRSLTISQHGPARSK